MYIQNSRISLPYTDTSTKPLESFLDWAAIWRKDAEHAAGFEEYYTFAKAHAFLTWILVPDTTEDYRKALDMGYRIFTSDDPPTAIGLLKVLDVR